MCISLRNAVAVLDHRDGRIPRRGYTCTRHHIGHLGPGDWWLPGLGAAPRTVTDVHRRDGRIILTDQYGIDYPYPADAVIPTAVPDPRITIGPTRAA
jgi:hypothetical protein